jgi:hypothetical protein
MSSPTKPRLTTLPALPKTRSDDEPNGGRGESAFARAKRRFWDVVTSDKYAWIWLAVCGLVAAGFSVYFAWDRKRVTPTIVWTVLPLAVGSVVGLLGIFAALWATGPARQRDELRRRNVQADLKLAAELRAPMMRDAEDFVTGVQQAVMALRDAIGAPERTFSDISVIPKALPEVDRRIAEAGARSARVHLHFGPDSQAATAADAAIAELRTAAGHLGPLPLINRDAARGATKRAEKHLAEFNRAAAGAIKNL